METKIILIALAIVLSFIFTGLCFKWDLEDELDIPIRGTLMFYVTVALIYFGFSMLV